MKKRAFTFEVFFMLVISTFIPISMGFNVNFFPKEQSSMVFNQSKSIYVDNSKIPFIYERNNWNVTFGGASYDEGFCVQQTNDGGYILTGTTLSYGAGDWDVWLIKTDFNGNEEWNTTFGGSGYDRGYSVQQTNDSGFILTGCTYSYGAGDWDVWLIKTDFNGNEVWNATFGGSGSDWGYSVQETNDFGYIITGYTDSYGGGLSDIWLIKTDINGIEEWQQTFGGSGHDRGYSVQQTVDDGYIITGYTVSYDLDDTGCDVWLIKTDSSGNQEWNKTYGGNGISNKVDIGYSVKQTDDGGYIIAGDTEIIFMVESDFLLIKTDSSGNEEWYRKFGGTSSDRGRSVQQTVDGGYAVLGWISSYGPGDSDVYLIKTNSTGNYEWNYTFKFEVNSSDWGYSVQQTKDDGYIIVGSTMPDGWEVSGSSKTPSEEGTDVWLIRIAGENQPPNKPIINGPSTGKPGTEYTFCITATDPEGDNLHVLWEWGDGTSSDWLGPFESGEEICDSHIWIERGDFIITVTLRDEHGATVTATFEISIPRNRVLISSYQLIIFDMFPILKRILNLIK